jgi:hypothetical protein
LDGFSVSSRELSGCDTRDLRGCLNCVTESGEVKASVAALLFVLATSARHGVDAETLSSELQQLGLPREHAMALCRVYSENLTAISSRLQDQSLRCTYISYAS